MQEQKPAPFFLLSPGVLEKSDAVGPPLEVWGELILVQTLSSLEAPNPVLARL